jgi:hypothetical protein
VWRDDRRETTVKGNDGGRWSSDDMMLWLQRKQNGDTVEWWGEWSMLRWSFYSSGGWELNDPRRIAYGGGADSMLYFQLKRGGDGIKCCQKMKRRQRAHLDLMRRKRDMTWRRWSEEKRHRGRKREEITPVDLARILLGQKIKKTHADNSAGTNGWWKFKAVMS